METMWAPWRGEYIMENAGKTGKETCACVFCTAPQTENDAERFIVHRGQSAYVILNLYPYNNGHLLIIPYKHCNRLEQLDQATHHEMMDFIVKAQVVLGEVYHPHGVNVGANIGAAAGAGIDQHLHFHVLPRWNADVNFMTTVAQTRVIPESLETTWQKLREAWRSLP